MRRLRPPSRASNSQHPRSTPDPSAASKGAQRQALPVLRALPVASSRGSARSAPRSSPLRIKLARAKLSPCAGRCHTPISRSTAHSARMERAAPAGARPPP
ncbi:hypothetical protein B0H15DRAFT_958652 [Mycena belliarum]|uniref:Uncharacterized protein n=1 Tax=Mycena belliarum TaxID=1033014 RepID=A0AAD6TML3_9AGAR|nr:hypothetical protein B0H15DRAFT_958652 [Mycena belliae]